MLWLTVILVVAAIGSALFAFMQARAAMQSRADAQLARDESREARDESARLAREANEAFIRQAEAQERANDLAEAALPRREVRWENAPLENGRWRLTNIGDVLAHEARLEVVAGVIEIDDTVARDVSPGDSLMFQVFLSGRDDPPRVRVTFVDRAGTMPERHELVITIPK